MKKVFVILSLIVALCTTVNADGTVFDNVIIDGLTVSQYTGLPNYWIVVLAHKQDGPMGAWGGFYINLGTSTTFTDEGKSLLARLMYAHSAGKKIMVRINNEGSSAFLKDFLPDWPAGSGTQVHTFDWALISVCPKTSLFI